MLRLLTARIIVIQVMVTLNLLLDRVIIFFTFFPRPENHQGLLLVTGNIVISSDLIVSEISGEFGLKPRLGRSWGGKNANLAKSCCLPIGSWQLSQFYFK